MAQSSMHLENNTKWYQPNLSNLCINFNVRVIVNYEK